MSEALAGFVGAIAGAFATVGTQGTLARLQNRNASRTAARLLHGDLLEARDIMLAVLRAEEWKHKRDLAHVVSAWREHRDAVARATKARDFHAVAGAFKAVEFIQLVRESNRELRDAGFALAREPIQEAIPKCDAARLVLARVGCSLWERYVTVRPKVERERLLEVPPTGRGSEQLS